MNITIFTSNQPRHISFVNRLASISETTYAVLECNTVFPGRVQDFYSRSDEMQTYFKNVCDAEYLAFKNISFIGGNVRSMAIKNGDLSMLSLEQLRDALSSDLYIVFGASYIKGQLLEFLIKKRAINIHLGVSPYYRGAACNFWALYDERPQYVGSTVHLLSKGLDSGEILYHAIPKLGCESPFEFTMKAVKAAHKSIIEMILTKKIFDLTALEQDKSLEIRYSKKSDFTDEVASNFLLRNLSNYDIFSILDKSIQPNLIKPYFFSKD